MNEFMTKWMLTKLYDTDTSDYDEHIYFNYASNKHYINIASRDMEGNFELEIAPNGRNYLEKQQGEKYE